FVTQEGAPPEKDPLVADLRELLESPIRPQVCILVAEHPEIAALAVSARQHGARTVLWAADAAEGGSELRGTRGPFLPLQGVLDLRPHSVALFVDYENVARSLAKQGFNIDPATLARGFIERARSFGRVAEARAYADWDQFLEHREADGRIIRRGAQRAFREAGIDTIYVLAGPNSADVQLARAVQSVAARQAR